MMFARACDVACDFNQRDPPGEYLIPLSSISTSGQRRRNCPTTRRGAKYIGLSGGADGNAEQCCATRNEEEEGGGGVRFSYTWQYEAERKPSSVGASLSAIAWGGNEGTRASRIELSSRMYIRFLAFSQIQCPPILSASHHRLSPFDRSRVSRDDDRR